MGARSLFSLAGAVIAAAGKAWRNAVPRPALPAPTTRTKRVRPRRVTYEQRVRDRLRASGKVM